MRESIVIGKEAARQIALDIYDQLMRDIKAMQEKEPDQSTDTGKDGDAA